jgi:hypothetical protein
VTVLSTRRASALLAALALVAGCSSGKPKAAPSPTPSETPSASPTPVATTTPKGPKSPFTGLPVDKLLPVLAIKIDNAPLARPQRGLDRADVVYEEAVEGRTTRFLAIFSSHPADDIGPVRSVRESDLDLLREYGRVAFGFSGGNAGVKAIVHRSPVIDVSYDAVPKAYTIAGRRRDAYNFITSTSRLLSLAPQAALAQDIGFRFGGPAKTGTIPATKCTVVWSHFATTSWTWNPALKLYMRSMDGAPAMLRGGAQMASPNVLIQYATVRNSRFSDVHGTVTPFTTTTGSGKALLLRDGKAVAGRWQRIGHGPTRFLDATGHDLLLHTGPVWVMLVPNDLRASVR